ncbi:MAG: hypothetical protein J6X66_09655, partial [Lachnospiraceae bacterium]|nr:hypothetical protein [Lachnospiraceae bacterium]
MKNYKKALIASAFIYFLAVLLFVVFTIPGKADPERDALVLKLNEIVHSVETDWGDPSVVQSRDYGADYAVTDMTGKVLYATGELEGDRLSVETAVKQGFPYSYVFTGGQLRGYVILLDDGVGKREKLRIRIIIGLCILGVILVAAAA